MRQVEEMKIILDTTSYSGWNPGNNAPAYTIENQEITVYSEDDEKECVALAKKKPKSIKILGKDQKVYFDPLVVFPKRKFQKKFRTNKIVNSPEKADVIISDYKLLSGNFSYANSQEYYPCLDGHYSLNRACPTVIAGIPSRKFGGYYYSWRTKQKNSGDKRIKLMNTILAIQEKPYMDVSNLHLTSSESLDIEAYEKIGKMMKSDDDNMKNMAISLLTAYDYETERRRIALLLGTHWNYMYRAARNIEARSMLRKLDIDYPGWNNGHMYNIGSWVKMMTEVPEDPVVVKGFNMWVKHNWAEAPDVKLVKI